MNEGSATTAAGTASGDATPLLVRVVAIAGGALAGFGLLLAIASQWSRLGRIAQFGAVEALVVLALIGALVVRRARVPLALVAFLSTGGLLALIGQAYQTGADAWQLFALWALLALPLCIAVASDVVWAPWALVAMTGISLWVTAHTGHRFRVDPGDLRAHGIGWMAAILVAAMLSRRLGRFTGSGVWAGRTAATLAIVFVTAGALAASFGTLGSWQYAAGLVVLAVAAWLFTLPETHDVYALSAAALGLDVLVIAGLAHLMLSGGGRDWFSSLVGLGLVSAGILAASVHGVLRVARARAAEEAA